MGIRITFRMGIRITVWVFVREFEAENFQAMVTDE